MKNMYDWYFCYSIVRRGRGWGWGWGQVKLQEVRFDPDQIDMYILAPNVTHVDFFSFFWDCLESRTLEFGTIGTQSLFGTSNIFFILVKYPFRPLKQKLEYSRQLESYLGYCCTGPLFSRANEQRKWLCWRGPFKNAYELLNLRALKISMLYKKHIFQCLGNIFCVEFQRVPLKFHIKYLTHTLKDVDFINRWKFKSS